MYDSSSEEEIQEVILVRRQRNFRLRTNFHFYAEYEFNERFRLRAENIETILNEIGERLQHPTRRNKALAPQQQLLIALHWLGNGGQYSICQYFSSSLKIKQNRILKTRQRFRHSCKLIRRVQSGAYSGKCTNIL
jgi:hypothetical protein